MRLNSDCIRDILLTAEEECDSEHRMQYVKDEIVPERLKKYSHNELLYHIRQCEYSKLIFKPLYYDCDTNIKIPDLTPEGHQFIANIREDKVWNGVKSIAQQVGSHSLNALTQISSNVIAQLIKSYFNLI